jgi:hypothetical protein
MEESTKKQYVKPEMKDLGLLRSVTKFSCNNPHLEDSNHIVHDCRIS